MEFEFDADKSTSNKGKHGIDFTEAQLLWEDPDLLEIPAITHDEPRFLAIGRIGQKLWSAIFTRRGNRLRLISVRRARDAEKDLYES